MYAVFVTGGKQYRAVPGEVLRVELMEAEPGSTVNIDQVLMIGDGDKITIGTPNVAGASVGRQGAGPRPRRQGQHREIPPPQALSQADGASAALHRNRDHRHQRRLSLSEEKRHGT
jgi:hypothetical protein